ncbi:recombination protein O N-terminal domain-containing protein [Patescibacteria group bacterium]|nr:recombination protein O N-terminal domain-containing protein [Patescibacteria group bacterium]
MHTTEGFVIGGIDTGESHRYLSLLTKEFGLIRAVARSVRVEQSKLRYNLQDLACVDISLVRGREVWRITGAKERYNTYWELRDQKKKCALLAQVTVLLRRLLAGEEKNERLFSIISNGIAFLRNEKLNDNELKLFEYLIILRILHSLGYIGKVAQTDPLVSSELFKRNMLTAVALVQTAVVRGINKALKESHL